MAGRNEKKNITKSKIETMIIIKLHQKQNWRRI